MSTDRTYAEERRLDGAVADTLDEADRSINGKINDAIGKLDRCVHDHPKGKAEVLREVERVVGEAAAQQERTNDHFGVPE